MCSILAPYIVVDESPLAKLLVIREEHYYRAPDRALSASSHCSPCSSLIAASAFLLVFLSVLWLRLITY